MTDRQDGGHIYGQEKQLRDSPYNAAAAPQPATTKKQPPHPPPPLQTSGSTTSSSADATNTTSSSNPSSSSPSQLPPPADASEQAQSSLSPLLPTLTPVLSTSPVRTFTIPRNKSTGSLRGFNSGAVTPGLPRQGSSMDSAAPTETGPFSPTQSSIDYDKERAGFGPSGLNRMRQQPVITTRATPPHAGQQPPRSVSMTLQIPSSLGSSILGAGSATPASPLLTVSDDLTRFPFESLHSFSFAHKPDDLIQARSNILKRSMEFMKDRLGWAAGGLGIVAAHAKISGDQDAQSVVDLLSKANVLGHEAALKWQGMATGPAMTTSDNIFEKGFLAHATVESPTAIGSRERLPTQNEQDEQETVASDAGPRDLNLQRAQTQPLPAFTLESGPESPSEEGDNSTFDEADDAGEDLATPTAGAMSSSDRPMLKRTFTDIASVSLQNKLSDALGQPFVANEQALSPTNSAFFNTAQAQATATLAASASTSSFPSIVPHAHGRAAPNTQAIFTTEAKAPWTLAAANDLACLTFGISKAEIRKTSILDMVAEDRRKWLESRLISSQASKQEPQVASPSPTSPASPAPSEVKKVASALGNGVTARLLSKPSSRETGKGQRTYRSTAESTVSGGDGKIKVSDFRTGKTALQRAPSPASKRSRGVILCGDVVSILKKNGSIGSATLWVQEKRGSLIWVMEEIAEDVAYVSLDEVGCVTKVTGHCEAVWGMERVRRGMDVTRIIPALPRIVGTNTGAIDYAKIAELRRFTARTANNISVPVTVDQLSGQQSFRVSSFPHIAGMIVLSASNLKVSSSNAVVCEALFGKSPDGLPMTDIIPAFDKMLNLLVEEDGVQLVEGLVIPEHSFRRARAMLAIREGRSEAASIFLRPSGVPALHRDGAEIMIDLQMRIMRNETYNQRYSENVIMEERDEPADFPLPQIVYAVWVTYSRALHAAHHGIGPVTPLLSRPATPPQQPGPDQAVAAFDEDSDDNRGHSKASSISETASVTRKSIDTASSVSSDATNTGSIASSTADAPTDLQGKKTIEDFVILEDMGAGAYGQVKLARPKENPSKKVVIKYVTKRRILVDTWTRDRRLGTVPLEIHVLNYLRRDGFRHPNIVEMSGFFEDDTNYYIEMVPHGLPGMDLFDYIELRVNMEEDECRRIFSQVASAVEFLHIKAKVVHRDIKDENVILDGEGNIKLIDFGSASYIRNGPFDVFVGTIDYAAPEVLASKSYTGLEQDVWALGILLYTILYKENPFYNVDEIMDHDLRVPYVVSEPSIALVRRMLDRDVDARIKIRDIVADNWCRGADDNAGQETTTPTA